jgi:hypothetical protein
VQFEDRPTDEERSDFLRQMLILAEEEGCLYEAPRGSTNLLADGAVSHGPWRPKDCSAVFAAWFSDGLIGLYRLGVGERNEQDLTAEVASDLLSSPQRWEEAEHVGVCLFVTDKGEQTPDAVWFR